MCTPNSHTRVHPLDVRTTHNCARPPPAATRHHARIAHTHTHKTHPPTHTLSSPLGSTHGRGTTASDFFHRYPELLPFLLSELREAARSQLELHPSLVSLYPPHVVLCVCGDGRVWVCAHVAAVQCASVLGEKGGGGLYVCVACVFAAGVII